ncbi:hypothetical protein CVD25_02495 [Bacillus canaveralius]|uniref:Uncharacterized protein n=1 Tax=Bacillus canaveralius TaxID=1403243 RepID=A0A2N5GJE3_9BACI|nr:MULTISPECIES: CamS family sex pheromone protein [Bacillus]PLR81300.1 hypothetical protein CU635_15460 [Bacillus canaveralius]PLR86493.1 hypothetical protein CVD23_06685 [Bacillus sp. V33-4]PLS00518.1 hypothetical protein CVD25_02495 [Bacillus canaveralius]RSK47649.1 CamS family sex pheromone protein [Bacillus canaveralius]
MKKLSMAALSLVLLLTACAPNFQQQEEVVQETDEKKEKAIIPKYKISDEYYRMITPFEPGEARGLVVNNLNTRYDINEFETGLMRLAQNAFDPNKYVFQEGQFLKKEQVTAWLNRKFTPAQLQARNLDESKNLGLNPPDDEQGTIDERNAKSPIYLAHILEHNYYIKQDNSDAFSLGGVVIGLALNSVHYYQREQFGATFERDITRSELDREGKKLAEEVIKRLRGVDELKEVPITIALFEQETRSSVVPGNFFAYTNVANGSASIGGWEEVNEDYVLFPSKDAEDNHREDFTSFQNFKQDVEEFFPNFNGVIGEGFYAGGQLQELSIDIPIQFYGKAEGIGFTQYVTGKVMEHFPNYISVQVSITSVNGPEALIVRKAEQDEPFVHIYE